MDNASIFSGISQVEIDNRLCIRQNFQIYPFLMSFLLHHLGDVFVSEETQARFLSSRERGLICERRWTAYRWKGKGLCGVFILPSPLCVHTLCTRGREEARAFLLWNIFPPPPHLSPRARVIKSLNKFPCTRWRAHPPWNPPPTTGSLWSLSYLWWTSNYRARK